MVGQKISHTKSIRNASFLQRSILGIWLTAVVLSCLAVSITTQALTSISQSYKTEENLPIGAIVSLKPNTTSDEVVAATTNNVDAIIGIVINNGDSILSLESKESGTVQVATSEVASVLVSDINGEIKQGDQITASPIKGVGMKATGNIKVIGVAQENPVLGTSQTYTDSNGEEQTVKLGQVRILVNASYFYKEPEKTLIPTAIQNIANALAGKTVETLPILISAAIFIITIIVVVSIIYSMIHSSIISVGRNPLSQSAIYRDLIQLSALVLVILGVGVIAIYLVLTRM